MVPALAGACASLAPSEAVLPPGAVEVAAPAMYQEWYRKTESCSGLTGQYASVQFYVVPGVETFPTAAGEKVGEWISDGRTHRIVIAGNYRDHEMVVRHELLHSLLKQEGHPSEYFVGRCQLTWDSWNRTLGSVVSGL
jgi:hypothetical protein